MHWKNREATTMVGAAYHQRKKAGKEEKMVVG